MSEESRWKNEQNRWKPGTSAHAALERLRAERATIADLLVLARTEIEDATAVLPPYAGQEGYSPIADPDHASACTVRARSFLRLVEQRLGFP